MSASEDIAISVEGLSKSYLIGHNVANAHETFREMVARQVRGFARSARDIARGRQVIQGDEVEEFWALKDVSFEIRRGEVMGVLGRNGAGKSTLLKVLSRITEPTDGRVRINGRVASLLEVGTGFHPELTGRENIYLNGAILGMSRREINAKFDEIVNFAEVERFLDTPVKRYSSGMYVRLAFAVAAHLEPEILIIDEVLAVGDVVFQKKCLGKMQSVADSGRTVLFVSHNMQTITGLTDRSILLEGGKVVMIGQSDAVVERYLSSDVESAHLYEKAPSGDTVEITRVALSVSGPGDVQQFGKPMSLEVDIWAPEPVPNANVSFQIFSSSEQPIAHVLNLDSEVPMLRQAGVQRLRCHFPKVRLFPGRYHLSFYLGASHPRRVFDAPAQICHFEVAVLDHVRDFYWAPDTAVYVEETEWKTISLPATTDA